MSKAKGSDYAWLITKDLLSDKGPWCVAGRSGPGDAPEALREALEAGKGHVFTLHDDDGDAYCTGRLVTSGRIGTKHYFAPLDDFGTGSLGCTSIRWEGHSAWNS